MADYVLDTSAILAVLHGEDGYESVEEILRRAAVDEAVTVRIPFLALMEVEYQLLRELSMNDAQHWLNLVVSWPVHVVESFLEWRHIAAAVKSQGKLSLADAWMAALALLNDATLVHKDPEFDLVEGLQVLRLPYDRDSGVTA